eukprot:CAMPEP_0174889806 /NCGR_PEP_ID=MMETSP0167-20121228/5007_1 /TAXON_ID=38298 /ORGANISM="Rhodella maculata, Strain CCMP736" /LENGTH=123 /DNA_ID=CAMNT_0016127339 /DNA_START=536 /DNA_END=903 /DNA_ORIENTATION=-
MAPSALRALRVSDTKRGVSACGLRVGAWRQNGPTPRSTATGRGSAVLRRLRRPAAPTPRSTTTASHARACEAAGGAAELRLRRLRPAASPGGFAARQRFATGRRPHPPRSSGFAARQRPPRVR